MSKIITADLKHYDRIEEQEILDYVAEHNTRRHVSVFGVSGTGKTEVMILMFLQLPLKSAKAPDT